MQLLELNAFPLLYQLCLPNFLSTSSLIALSYSTGSTQAWTTQALRADYWNQIKRGSHHSLIVVIFDFLIGEAGFKHGILMASNPEVAQSLVQCDVLYLRIPFILCANKEQMRRQIQSALARCCYVMAVMKEDHCGDRPAQCPSRHKPA